MIGTFCSTRVGGHSTVVMEMAPMAIPAPASPRVGTGWPRPAHLHCGRPASPHRVRPTRQVMPASPPANPSPDRVAVGLASSCYFLVPITPLRVEKGGVLGDGWQ